jgi:transposase
MIKHSEEFKQEAVRIALTSGLPRARVAADLGVGKSTLGQSLGASGWRTIHQLIW